MSRSLVFIVAAEASGDRIGADLIQVLRRRDPSIRFAGVGGPAMNAQGVESVISIADLGIVGLVDALAAYGRVVRLADAATNAARALDPDAVVLIDSWGFTIRVAQRLKRIGARAKRIKYIGPQVWATRPGRAKTLAEAVDHLICIHAFETPYYAPYGLPCTVCGLPAFSRERRGDADALRTRLGLAPDRRILLLLPGSRRGEVTRIGPVLAEAARRLKAVRPDLAIGVVAAEPVAALIPPLIAPLGPDVFIVPEAQKEDAFAAAAVALAASGTVTTEVAMQGAPVVVGYVTGPVTAFIALNFLLKSRWVTLMNVAADREVAPEFLQGRCTPENLVAAAAPLLDDAAARAAQVRAQNAALQAMGRGGRPASEIAADVVMQALAEAP